jgi:hypothetical protein
MNLRVTLNKETFSVQFSDTSTAVLVRVHDWGTDSDGDPRTLVLVSSLILRDVKPSPALFEWIARNGGAQWFGHVEAHDSNQDGQVDLWMSHTLLGDFLDEKELETAMWSVLTAADAWDDELQQRFGGKRWVDA